MIAAFAMAAAFLLDAAFGEPRRAHPLVAFGRVAARIERAFHAPTRLAGALAWVLAVVPAVASAWLASRAAAATSVALDAAFGAVMLYLALGLRSLGEHARAVADALARDDLVEARVALARIVSRDTAALDGGQIAAAATESVLENGNDAVFGALFWFAVLGVPGAVLYRLANTLDAMWGYRTPRYDRFGWAAARIDDGLNYVPARLTALTYALFGDGRRALRCWRTQARRWKSPNAGPVMAAGAGALGVRLGGAARYHGVWQQRPALGEGADADGAAIERALQLVWRGAVLWVVVVPLVAALVRLGHAHA